MAGACGRSNRSHSKAVIYDFQSSKESRNTFRGMNDANTDYRIVVLGSAGVGKTNCVLRFVNGQYRENYIPTVEDTYRQVVACNKQITTLQITDTTGTHQFPAMQRLSIQKGHAFMLLYSITRKQTLEELKPIYNQIREIKGDQLGETPILLMGCKLDEAACREVTESIGKQLANYWSCAWIETSSKTNSNIREAFQELLKLDRRRNFNFNVDSDSYSLDENSKNSATNSPALLNIRRITATVSAPSTMNNNTSNAIQLDLNPSTNSGATNNQMDSSKSSKRTLSPKHRRSASDSQDFSKTGKKYFHHENSPNRTSTKKCHIM